VPRKKKEEKKKKPVSEAKLNRDVLEEAEHVLPPSLDTEDRHDDDRSDDE